MLNFVKTKQKYDGFQYGKVTVRYDILDTDKVFIKDEFKRAKDGYIEICFRDKYFLKYLHEFMKAVVKDYDEILLNNSNGKVKNEIYLDGEKVQEAVDVLCDK